MSWQRLHPGASSGARIPAVWDVTVNPATEAICFRYDDATTSPDSLRAAVELEGYRTARPLRY